VSIIPIPEYILGMDLKYTVHQCPLEMYTSVVLMCQAIESTQSNTHYYPFPYLSESWCWCGSLGTNMGSYSLSTVAFSLKCLMPFSTVFHFLDSSPRLSPKGCLAFTANNICSQRVANLFRHLLIPLSIAESWQCLLANFITI